MAKKAPTHEPAAAGEAAPESAAVLYACTVLVNRTKIGKAICAAGKKVRLPKPEAEALASLNPPKVRIDGI